MTRVFQHPQIFYCPLRPTPSQGSPSPRRECSSLLLPQVRSVGVVGDGDWNGELYLPLQPPYSLTLTLILHDPTDSVPPGSPLIPVLAWREPQELVELSFAENLCCSWLLLAGKADVPIFAGPAPSSISWPSSSGRSGRQGLRLQGRHEFPGFTGPTPFPIVSYLRQCLITINDVDRHPPPPWSCFVDPNLSHSRQLQMQCRWLHCKTILQCILTQVLIRTLSHS